MNILGWHVVIFGGHGEIRPTHSAVADSKAVKCLWAGYFVHKMEIYIEEIGFTGCRVDDVAIPYFLGKREGFGHTSIQPSERATVRADLPWSYLMGPVISRCSEFTGKRSE